MVFPPTRIANKKKKSKPPFKNEFCNYLQNFNDFYIDVGLFDFDRFGLGDFFVIFLITERSKDGNLCTFGKLLNELLIDILDELLAVMPRGKLDLFAIAIGIVAVSGIGEGDS